MRAPVRAIRAEARVDQRGRQGRIRGTVWMFVERPDRVRFDAMTQLGPAAILTSDGAQFALTDFREERFLEGPACPSNLARLLGISLSGEALAELLLGGVPVLPNERSALTCVGDGTYQAVLTAPDGTQQRITLAVREHDLDAPIEEQRLRLRRVELVTAEGETIWRASYAGYRVIPVPGAPDGMGVAMPMRVHFVQPGFDTVVRFEEMTLNPEIPPDVFVQLPRPGMERERVPCETGSGVEHGDSIHFGD